MKSLIVFIVFTLVATPCFAQYPYSNSNYGSYSGANYQSPYVVFVPMIVPMPYIPYKSPYRQARYAANRQHARMVRAKIEEDRLKKRAFLP
jgi:hypothetical protein